MFALGRVLLGQCSAVWTGEPGGVTLGVVSASAMWDPDGAGPTSALAVVSQRNPATGDSTVSALDLDTGSWSQLGPAFFGNVRAIVGMPDGGHAIGGTFTQIGGVLVNRIALWTGSAWQQVAAGATHEVTALAAMPDGALVASGRFTNLGSAVTIARWNGQAWTAIGGGEFGNYPPRDLGVLPNGELVAGGWFSTLDGAPLRGAARWDGSTWQAIGDGLPIGSGLFWPNVLTVGPGGELYAEGGWPSTSSHLFHWSGTAWELLSGPIGSGGTFNAVFELAALSSGQLIAAGNFTLGGVESFAALWDGTAWSAMPGSPLGGIATLLELPGGDVFAGGNFGTWATPSFYGLARWNGASWQSVLAGGAPNGAAYSVASLPGGGMVVGGRFTMLGAQVANHVAVWRDGGWSTLGAGVGAATAAEHVRKVVVMPDGDVVVGGQFGGMGNLARWDGSAWHDLGGGVSGGSHTAVADMVVMPDGALIVAGSFTAPVPWLARWDGSSWSGLGAGWQRIQAVAVTPDGHLLVAYDQAGGANVMCWDGVDWTQVGGQSPAAHIFALDVAVDGTIYAGGQWPAVTAWSDSQWSPVGSLGGLVRCLRCLPGGDLVVGGTFTSPGSHIVRWQASTWAAVGGGVDGDVEALTMLATGELAVAGDFVSANGGPGAYVTMLSSSCPAGAASHGAGCSGAAGPIQLTAQQWPLLGGRMRARTTGLTANSLAIGVFGFSLTDIPLSAGHPAGLPGCDVLVADEILIEFLVGAGGVDSAIDVPSHPMLLGTRFHHQVVPVELDAAGSIAAITSSNALILTIGAL